ncbi:MAG: lysostaphin resistance A-like protein, partial [Thermodesulfobacteriota bacterium]
IIIALVYSSFAVFIYAPDPNVEAGPLTEMLLTPGPLRIFWIFLALFFAPLVEEFLFRGVMLAGFAYSLGIYKASIIVTLVFVAVHAFEAVHYPPAFGGITFVAIAVLYLRLKYKALGPSIAAHFGYNFIIALASLLGG